MHSLHSVHIGVSWTRCPLFALAIVPDTFLDNTARVLVSAMTVLLAVLPLTLVLATIGPSESAIALFLVI